MTDSPKANWWQRAGAAVIDALLLAVPIAIGTMIAAPDLKLEASALDSPYSDANLALTAVIVLASFIYSPLLMSRPGERNGQTVGKQVLGIRVVHADGGDMTVPRGLLRDGVGKIVGGLLIPLYGLIDILFPLFDRKQQALHDKIGRTYVVLARAGDTLAPPVSPDALDRSADAPHSAWSRPSQPVPPAGGYAPPAPPTAPPGDHAPPPVAPPDLGGFAPPRSPSAPSPDADEDPPVRGPFGPSGRD